MKKKNHLFAAFGILLVAVIVVILLFRPDKKEKLVQELLNETLAKTESKERAEKAEEKLKKSLGKYFSEDGYEDFRDEMFSELVLLYAKEKDWSVEFQDNKIRNLRIIR